MNDRDPILSRLLAPFITRAIVNEVIPNQDLGRLLPLVCPSHLRKSEDLPPLRAALFGGLCGRSFRVYIYFQSINYLYCYYCLVRSAVRPAASFSEGFCLMGFMGFMGDMGFMGTMGRMGFH